MHSRSQARGRGLKAPTYSKNPGRCGISSASRKGEPPMGIYVETFIHGSMEELWRRTQTPDLHEQWDLRFSHITYLPRPDLAEPQQFLYETRIGFGLAIRGKGE